MCTAILLQAGRSYFGRTLDLEHTYSESVTITPRNVPLPFRHLPDMFHHHALIGIAHVADGYPLYYDAINEYGLGIAALSFPCSACYQPKRSDRDNIAPFELIAWILGQCATVEQALPLLVRANLVDLSFSPELPLTPLHWLLTDGHRCVVLEPMADGLQIFDNPVGVLTNNPPFPAQMRHLAQFLSLSPEEPDNRLIPNLPLHPDSRGTGALGLPGDFSSSSRFVRAAFLRTHSCCDSSEEDRIGQFFHLFDCVSPIQGSIRLKNGGLYFTRYTSCCSLATGTYYYTTYENRQITGVSMHTENLDGHTLVSYPLIRGQQIYMQNQAIG